MKINDRVKCINLERCEELQKNKIYTIKIISNFQKEPVIVLKECPQFAYSTKFFKKI